VTGLNLIKDYKIDCCFGGIYSKDLLPKDLKRATFYIVNMQDHDEGNGTHWVVFYYNNPLSACGYFCMSFIKFLHSKQDKQEEYKAFLQLLKNETVKNDKILQRLLY
jgi:hypothetical protein